MRNYIPHFHLGYSAKEKLTTEWWKEAIQHCYYQSNNVNLLHRKNINEIDEYATGDIKMHTFRKMFKSVKRKEYDDRIDYDQNEEIEKEWDGYEALPLLPTKLISAQNLLEKTPVEVSAEATDALAWEKKMEDVQFLRHKPEFEAGLQELSDKMNLGQVDLGTTKHTATPFSSSPYGLDLYEADELQVFIGILSALSVEAALETILQSYWDFKRCDTLKGMWIKDELRYGVSCHQSFSSAITGLPDIEYVYPGEISCPESDYPDFRDNEQRIRDKYMTVIDLFNWAGDEIPDEDALFELINGQGGYCALNGCEFQRKENFGSFKVYLKYIEVKSVDWIGVVPVNKKSKFLKLTDDEKEVETFKGTKHWAQNTYCAWWLVNTNTFLKKSKLDSSYRAEGQEYLQGFSICPYRSVKKSAVELSIPQNKKAQIADIKMQHAVKKAKKSGIYIDLKFLRSGAEGLKDSKEYSIEKLIKMALQENDFIGDTQGFDGKNEANFQPFRPIPGGLGQDIQGYAQIILDASNKIGDFTGINDQLTGQSGNPTGLIGMQQLLVNASSNAIGYVNRAVQHHCVHLFNNWWMHVKNAIEAGGKRREAIVNLIGNKKANLLAAISDLPLHQMGIKVEVTSHQLQEQKYEIELQRLKDKGVINAADEYILSAIRNLKDRFGLLAVKEKQFDRKQAMLQRNQNEQQQVLAQQQGKNQQDAIAAKVNGDKEKIYAQGDVSSKILQLAAQLGLNEKQVDGMIKKSLQTDRNNAQLDKNVKTLQTKSELENQKPFE